MVRQTGTVSMATARVPGDLEKINVSDGFKGAGSVPTACLVLYQSIILNRRDTFPLDYRKRHRSEESTDQRGDAYQPQAKVTTCCHHFLSPC